MLLFFRYHLEKLSLSFSKIRAFISIVTIFDCKLIIVEISVVCIQTKLNWYYIFQLSYQEYTFIYNTSLKILCRAHDNLYLKKKYQIYIRSLFKRKNLKLESSLYTAFLHVNRNVESPPRVLKVLLCISQVILVKVWELIATVYMQINTA